MEMTTPRRKKNGHKNDNRKDLLEKHSEMQKEVLKDISNIMKEM